MIDIKVIIGKKYNIVTKEVSYFEISFQQARLKLISLSRQILCEINLHYGLIYEDISDVRVCVLV